MERSRNLVKQIFQHTITAEMFRHIARVGLFKRPNSHAYSTLVLCEHRSQKLNPSTLSTISAATQLNQKPVVAVVVGSKQDASVAETVSKIDGVDKVIFASNDTFLKHQMPEAVQVAAEKAMSAQGDLTHIVAPHTVWGKNVLPRLAVPANSQPISDVIKIESDTTFVRPIYAGNAIQHVTSSQTVKVLSVRPTAFERAPSSRGDQAPIENVDLDASAFEGRRIPEFVKEDLITSDRPELTDARVVVSGGRGLKNGENFKILYELADLLGGAVGATRAVVDAGFVSNDLQVGQTGKVVAPDLYIACGISGQLQHIAGMKDSKCIVAINKDPEAPFFQVADYGLVDDLFNAVPALTEKVRADKH